MIIALVFLTGLVLGAGCGLLAGALCVIARGDDATDNPTREL